LPQKYPWAFMVGYSLFAPSSTECSKAGQQAMLALAVS